MKPLFMMTHHEVVDARIERSRLIESEGQEEDTYWIYLRLGFHNGAGEHAIAEDTRRAARARLSDVTACECHDCKERGSK